MRDRMLDLKKDFRLRYILIFKNHGEGAGATLEHPHSQLIALPIVPKRVIEEMEGAKRHFDYRERCIYCDIIQHEAESQQRVVLETDHFTVLCRTPRASRSRSGSCRAATAHTSRRSTTPRCTTSPGSCARCCARWKGARIPPFNLILNTAPVQDPDYDYYTGTSKSSLS